MEEIGRKATTVQSRALLRLESPSAVHWSIEHLQHHAAWTATHSHAAFVKWGCSAPYAPHSYYDTVYLIFFWAPLSYFHPSTTDVDSLQRVVGLVLIASTSPVSSDSARGGCFSTTDAPARGIGWFHRGSLSSSRQTWRTVTLPLGLQAAATSHVQCRINKPRHPTTGSPCRCPGVRRSPNASCDMTARGRKKRLEAGAQAARILEESGEDATRT